MKRLQVVFTPFAERQIDSLHAYISSRSNKSRADGCIDRIVTFCMGLSTFPLRGTVRDTVMQGLRTVGFERRVNIAFVVSVCIYSARPEPAENCARVGGKPQDALRARMRGAATIGAGGL